MPHLAANLTALRSHFPSLADLIQSTPIPEGFVPTIGTDNTTTFARTHSRRVEWLGSTSMPRASAESIISSLDAISGGANGLGLAIGTGCEWAAFLQRLGRAQCLYVYEPDPAHLRMALDVCDLSAALGDRRLILFTGNPESAAAELAKFLNENLGFEPPSVLHPLPTAGAGMPERRNQFLAAGEVIVRRAVEQRHVLLAALHEKLAQAAAAPSTKNQPIAAFLLSERFSGERPIHAQAARENAAMIAIDHHSSTSHALRLRSLIHLCNAGTPRILSDLFRAQLGTLPAQFPIYTWAPPLTGPAFWDRLPAPETFAPHDRIIIQHAHHAEQLRNKKIPDALIELKPLTRGFTTSPKSSTSNQNQKTKIAIIADLPAHTAAALGINLPTHEAIFAAAAQLIEADYLTIHPAAAPDLLRRALLRANLDPDTRDPAIAESFLRIIRDVLIPAIPLVTLAKTLREQNLETILIGDWPAAQADRHVPFQSYTTNIWDEVAILAHLAPTGIVPPLIWGAINKNTLIAAPQHPTDPLHGSLPQLLAPDKQYARARPLEFLNLLKSLLRDAPRREQIAAAAKL